MSGHNGVTDIQSQAQPPSPLGQPVLTPVEPLKNAPCLPPRYAYALVGNGYRYFLVTHFAFYTDDPALGRVFNSVINKIYQYFFQQGRVGGYSRKAGGESPMRKYVW
jgi:hypothetical protein